MLLELTIENLALVQKTSLSFDSGLTVITGESGAGKSLIILALKLLMGGKPRGEHVRTGQNQAIIQAALDWPVEANGLLEELGIEQDENLVVRRVISASGKSRNYLNGTMATQQVLQNLIPRLISLAGQHEFQGLLNENNHLIWLDRFAGLEPDLYAFSQILAEYKRLLARVKEAQKAREKAQERRKMLQKDIVEIDSLNPVPGEEDALLQEARILKEVTTIRQIAETIYERLYAKKGAALEIVADLKDNFKKITTLDASISHLAEPLNSSFYQLEEVAEGIRRYLASLPTDINRLDEIETRLYAIKELKRHFGAELEEILRYRRQAEEELCSLENLDQDQAKLSGELRKQEDALIEAGIRLSALRRDAAASLSEAVQQELSKLKLLSTGYKVEVITKETCAANATVAGFDSVRFLFSANVGEPLRPLSAIASGGELSRVMLAVKTALARKTQIETMIFDEIDSGLGGELAECVGRELKQLAEDSQVIAITHFPQIAALSDHHIAVVKAVDDESTVSKAFFLKDSEREQEIARMLGSDTESARKYARSLLSINN